MAVSASDSLSQIPGFRDRLGERVIVPQQSGALLEFLHFSNELATAPFFSQTLKDRVGRLANFRHSSYCRVRRLQSIAERDGRPALVSAHIAGQRLSEVLEVAARTDLRPSTAGVLAVTRQLMASVALLHDFAPYGFHGAIGPERLILAGEGRIVVAEHVLGTLVEEAAAAWGVTRLWHDFRVAVLPEPTAPHYGRRVDVAQVGLTTLAMLLGRPLGGADYPDGLADLIGQVEETTPEGTRVPLRLPLRGWLERTLALSGDASFRTLLEAQKSFGQLLQEEDYAASSAEWEAFVGVCETAALRVPVVVASEPPRTSAGAPAESEPAVDFGLPGLPAAPPQSATTATTASAEPAVGDDAVARLKEDPFGPWPVATSTGSAASLLEAFEVPAGRQSAAAALAEVADTRSEADAGRPASALWTTPPGALPASVPEPRPETLFEAPPPPAGPLPPPTPVHTQTRSWEEPKAPAATSVADWGNRPSGRDPTFLPGGQGQRRDDFEADEFAEQDEVRSALRTRRTRLAVLVGLALLAATAAAFAPYAWKVMFEGRRVSGTLTVDSEPAGAVISVDGQVRGHTPAELSLKAGDHLLEVQTGGSATSKTITVKANERIAEKLTFPEAGERGGLMITTYPSRAKIAVDGVPRGHAPVKVTDLSPGTHTLLVETSFGEQEQDVVVQSGRVSQLSVPTVSWIKVTAPFELTVYDSGRLIGTTGSAPVMVAPGRRNLDFVNKSVGLKIRQFVDAVAGQVVTVPLELPSGMMNLYSDQPAEVLVDGKPVGQTPLPGLPVPLGSHEVVFRNARYGEVRYTVAVTLVAPVQITVTFRK